MRKNRNRKAKYYGFYCTDEESTIIKALFSASIYTSFTEYVITVLMQKPVYIKYGPASMNALVDELIAIRNGMEATLRHTSLSDEDKVLLMGMHKEIKTIISKIADLCVQLSGTTKA